MRTFTRVANMSPGLRDTGDVIDADHINELQQAAEDLQTGALPIALAGIAGALGEARTTPGNPIYATGYGVVNALAYGELGEGMAVQRAIDAAAGQAVSGGGTIVDVPACRTFWLLDSPLLVYPGVTLRGAGAAYNSNVIGTTFAPSSSFAGGALIRVVGKGDVTTEYAHYTRLLDFMVRQGPSHGVHWATHYGEMSIIDGVDAIANGGDGIRIDNGGPPVQVGRVGAFGNDGAGVRLANCGSINALEFISGDNNLDGLLHIEDSGTYALYIVGGIKAERQTAGEANVIIRLDDLRGGHLSIGGMYVGANSALTPSPDPMIWQTSSDSTPISGTVSAGRIVVNAPYGGWSAGYQDDVSGLTLSMYEISSGGFSTQRQRVYDPERGIAEDAPVILTGSVGTAETAWAHGQLGAPSIANIVPHGDARVWRSSPPDANYIYLQASAVVTCDVSLGRGTPQTAYDGSTQYDTFTDTDGTSVTAHTPDTGGAWSASGAWSITGNRARPGGNYRLVYVDVGSVDFWAALTFDLGNDGLSRGIGLPFRISDTSNYWIVTVNKAANGDANVILNTAVANAFTQIKVVNISLLPSTDHTMTVELRSGRLRVRINNDLMIDRYLSTYNATATAVGFYSGPNSVASGVSVDRIDIRS